MRTSWCKVHNHSADRNARFQRVLIVSLIGLALGFLVVVQLRSQAAVARTLASQDNTSVALLINDLNRANNQLIQQAAALSQQETQLRQALLAGGADAQAISKELQTLREVAGGVPVDGLGLRTRVRGRVRDLEVQDLGPSLGPDVGEACP